MTPANAPTPSHTDNLERLIAAAPRDDLAAVVRSLASRDYERRFIEHRLRALRGAL